MEEALNKTQLGNWFEGITDFRGIGKEAKLVRNIVPIESWLNEEFYSGPSSYQIYPYWKQAIIKVFNSPERINEVILGGSIGTGKGEPISTLIPTPEGPVRLGDLKVGDFVFNEEGKPTKVVGVYDRGRLTTYKVTFTDNSYLIVDGSHLWTLYRFNNGNLYEETFNTERMYNAMNTDGLFVKGKKTTKYSNYRLPIAKPIQYNKRDLKVHPYVLGALIADGTLGDKSRICWTKSETDIVDEMRKYIVLRHNENDKNSLRYYIAKCDNEGLHDALDYYGILGKKSKDKYIHEDFLYSSIEDRKELLYGLMDGDGSVRHTDRGVANAFYNTTSKELADNIVQLVTSLGGIVKRRDYKNYYSLTICTDFNPFKRSVWKKIMDESLKNRKKSNVNRKIKSVEIYGEDEIRCIKVDNKTSLYIGDTQFNIVTHNTTIACYMIAYKLYELSCYYPPQALYNLMNNSKILFAYFNINKEVAGQVGFAQIRELLDSIPYFQNIFKRNERINSILEWPHEHIYMKSASSSNDVIGMNLISFFVDEANFFKGDGVQNKGTSVNDVQSKARELYNSVRTRGKSRFVVNNEDFTFNVLVSSSMYDSSFTAERIQASIGDPHVMVFEPKIWEVKNVDTYSKERFVVFSGNELIDPVICNSVADINYIRAHYRLPEVKCDTPNEAIKDIKDYDIKKRFIEVPENFRKEFEGNIIQALQDIAGVPVSATGKLFSNRDSYARALTDEESPFTQDQIVISTNANTTIQDYFKKDWRPKDVTKKRFIHFDQSTSGDSYGAAQCYIDSITYDEYGLPKVNIKFDWMIRINPPKPPHKIDLAKVRSIIPWQERVFGISYGGISYDTFQSAEAVQDLEKSGYPVKFRSVDRSDKEYLDLTELYYQGRIHHYRNEWYEKELFGLNWYRAQGKVDHPPIKEGGTKDVSDAVCGSVANALEYPSVEEVQRENDIDYFLSGSSNDNNYLNDRDELLSGFGNIY